MFGLGRRRGRSKDHLKDRLKLVLSYDRAKLSPGRVEDLKRELLDVIHKYFPSVDEHNGVDLQQHGDHMVFTANLPLEPH